MSLLQLALDHKPVDVAFSHSGTRIAVLSETDVAIYALDLQKRPITRPTLIWRGKLEGLAGHSPRHVAFRNNEQLYVMSDVWDEEESFIWTVEENINGGDGIITEPSPILEPGRISSIASDVEGEHVFVNFHNGNLNSVRQDDSTVDFPALATLPSFASEVKVAKLEEQVCIHRYDGKINANAIQSVAFGLTKSGVLYANERVLVRNCTSFTVTPVHLIFTTTQHLLKFVHLTTLNGK